MKQYKTTKKTVFARLLIVVLTISLFAVHACKDDADDVDKDHNMTFAFTRAGETPVEQIPSIRLFTFYHDNAAPNDKMFHGEVLNLARNLAENKVSAQVETGIWNMALLATPNGGNIIPPVAGTVMSELPMYKYQPIAENNRSSDAHELFLDNRVTPNITSGGSHTMTAQLNRTVAKVELIIEKTTPNFNLNGTHSIKLHNVPSTISYTGALLPSKTMPDTLAAALSAPILLEDAGNGSYEGRETITFIIPAHRGVDYIDYTGTTPIDTTTLKMDMTVSLERTGGTRFAKQVEIPLVAKANMILRVHITVNDGLEFKTEVLNWQGVPLDMTVGAGYRNWLYVKKGATGNGISWSDALPDISTAITKATALMATGKTVNGVLVAGGSDASMLYNEAFDIPQNVKVYGGWAGTPGTELAENDATAPYTSADRDLKAYKARVNTGNGNITLTGTNTILDGFAVSGLSSSSAVGLVSVFDETAWANAIEIDQQTSIASTYALSVSGGTGTNILVSRNNKGVSVAGSGKLVNATIANNADVSSFSGILLNTIYWGNSGAATTTGTINYCAFQGTAPVGTNYPLNDTNDAWFTTSAISVPGPHFNQTADAATPYYAASTTAANRAPQLNRGDQASFNNATTIIAEDIYGNPRHHNGTDIGCYESTGTQKGFEFRWNMSDIYISPKVLIESDHPALLFDNSESAYVEWEADNFVITNNRYSSVTGTTSGSGNTVNLGSFKLKSGPAINSGSTDLSCGSLVLKCQNIDKAYFPDVQMTVYQSPATSVVWTEGYAGSFHRWNETEPRYIFGVNTGVWTARIINGHDWIKIDGKPRPADPNNDTEVEETFGGVVTGTGNIVFRVGMKSKLANAESQPRYGLISITRTASGKTGVALFFVRQGEAADYLYGPDDQRTLGERTEAVKFTVYNMTDPQGRFSATGVTLPVQGGGYVSHPSKTGYMFKWNDLRAFYPDNSITGTNNNILSTDYHANCDFSSTREICPDGYHTPTEPEWVHSYFLNRAPNTSGAGSASGTTFVWGRLADGYFDKYADQNATSYGIGPDRATDGLLMYNDYNNASVFFPQAGKRVATTHAATSTKDGFYYNSSSSIPEHIAWYFTSSPKTSSSTTGGYANTSVYTWGTHCYGTGTTGHLGMSCTAIYKYEAASIRCVKK